DGHTVSRDAISITDAAVYRSLDLTGEPDDGATLYKDEQPLPLNFAFADTYAPLNPRRTYPDPRFIWSRQASGIETLLVVLPLFLAALLCLKLAPFYVPAALMVAWLVIAFLGRARRRREARRTSRS